MSMPARFAVPVGDPDAPGLVRGDHPFDVAAGALRLLATGPQPLAIEGRAFGGGLPRRRIPLSELAAILMHPSCGYEVSDRVWRLLIERARTGGPAWVVGAVGVALPGLRQAAYRLRHSTGDVEAELLAAFVVALAHLNPAGPRVVQRLLSATFTAARATLRTTDPTLAKAAPVAAVFSPTAGHPDVILLRAVAAGVIKAEDAELIGATRLDGVSVVDYAARVGKAPKAVYKARDRAEAFLVAAVRAGDLSDSDAEVIAEATMTVLPDPHHG